MFEYPATVPVPKHGPRGYTDYSNYKPWLRDEFVFRCVYCLEREAWYPDREDSFAVEHIHPQATDTANITNYFNLAYACGRCNSLKQTVLLLDPRREALGLHVRVGDDGRAEGVTDEGWILIEQLHLNEWPALDNRRTAINIYQIWLDKKKDDKINRLFLEKFGYPTNLPDLETRLPPLGNSIVGSAKNSYYRMRAENRLPAVY